MRRTWDSEKGPKKNHGISVVFNPELPSWSGLPPAPALLKGAIMNQIVEFGQKAGKGTEMSVTNLEQILSNNGFAGKRRVGTLVGQNLGHNTLTLAVPMHEFF